MYGLLHRVERARDILTGTIPSAASRAALRSRRARFPQARCHLILSLARDGAGADTGGVGGGSGVQRGSSCSERWGTGSPAQGADNTGEVKVLLGGVERGLESQLDGAMIRAWETGMPSLSSAPSWPRRFAATIADCSRGPRLNWVGMTPSVLGAALAGCDGATGAGAAGGTGRACDDQGA